MAAVEVVIPAYNEETTIGAVVAAARSCTLVKRVLVVDDGSSDCTGQKAREAGAEVITLRPNQGKTAALLAGAAHADEGVVVVLDGDLVSLGPGHLELLAAPVLAGEADMTVGVFADGRWLTDLSQHLTPFLNGQRAVRRDLLVAALRNFPRQRYAADTLLSIYARRRRAAVRHIMLNGLTHVMKEEKLGCVRGVLSRLRMFGQILPAFFARWPRDPGAVSERHPELERR